MQTSGLVTVIITNWNGIKTIGRCLESVMAQTYRPIEVVVADNASSDGSQDFIRKRFPEVKLLCLQKNLGYSGGNNAAFQTAQGRYYFVLNNDAELAPDCAERCVDAIQRHPRYGACAVKLVLDARRDRIDAAGITVFKDGLSIGRGRLEPAGLFDSREEVFFASGGACLFKREMIDDIGSFDHEFFCYAEDADMGWRAQLRGWKCIYEPGAVVYHCHSASTGPYSPFKAFYVERNRMWVAWKNFPWPLVAMGFMHTLHRYVYQSYGAFAGRGAAGEFVKRFSKMQLAKILFSVYGSFFRTLPSLLRRRREIQSRRLVTDKEINEIFKKYGISARGIGLKS